MGGGGDNSSAIKRQAEEEKRRYEAQIRAQREAALLEGKNISSGIAQVEVGGTSDYNFMGDSGSTKKKRRGDVSASTSLGIR